MKKNVFKTVYLATAWGCTVALLLMLTLMFTPYWVNRTEVEVAAPEVESVVSETEASTSASVSAATEDVSAEAVVETAPVVEETAVVDEAAEVEETIEVYTIAEYVWLPFMHPEIGKYFEEELRAEININREVLAPVALLACAVLGIIFQVAGAKKNSIAAPVFAVLGTVAGVYGYFFRPVMKLGEAWMLHVVTLFVGCVLGVVSIVFYFLNAKNIKKVQAAGTVDYSVGTEVCGFLMPRIFLALTLLFAKPKPETAKRLGFGAVAFFVALLVVYVLPKLLFNNFYSELAPYLFDGYALKWWFYF